jgi:hypothetical protein
MCSKEAGEFANQSTGFSVTGKPAILRTLSQLMADKGEIEADTNAREKPFAGAITDNSDNATDRNMLLQAVLRICCSQRRSTTQDSHFARA